MKNSPTLHAKALYVPVLAPACNAVLFLSSSQPLGNVIKIYLGLGLSMFDNNKVSAYEIIHTSYSNSQAQSTIVFKIVKIAGGLS